MKTDVIVVSSKGKQIETALEQVEKVAAYKGLSLKSTLHLRLLTEEMMQMIRSITGEPEGEFWIEDRDGEYSLHLKVATRLSIEKREQLLSVSGRTNPPGASWAASASSLTGVWWKTLT